MLRFATLALAAFVAGGIYGWFGFQPKPRVVEEAAIGGISPDDVVLDGTEGAFDIDDFHVPHTHAKIGGKGSVEVLYDRMVMRPAKKQAPAVATSKWISPVDVWRQTSPFGRRQLRGRWTAHTGVDLAATGTYSRAVADGTVIRSAWATSAGNYVVLRHDDGHETLYAHHEKNLAHAGERLKAGTRIGIIGETGNATGPHLHFEVRKDGRAVDPSRFFR